MKVRGTDFGALCGLQLVDYPFRVLTWLVVRCDPSFPVRRTRSSRTTKSSPSGGRRPARTSSPLFLLLRGTHATVTAYPRRRCGGRVVGQVHRRAVGGQGGYGSERGRWRVATRRRRGYVSCDCSTPTGASGVSGGARGRGVRVVDGGGVGTPLCACRQGRVVRRGPVVRAARTVYGLRGTLPLGSFGAGVHVV